MDNSRPSLVSRTGKRKGREREKKEISWEVIRIFGSLNPIYQWDINERNNKLKPFLPHFCTRHSERTKGDSVLSVYVKIERREKIEAVECWSNVFAVDLMPFSQHRFLKQTIVSAGECVCVWESEREREADRKRERRRRRLEISETRKITDVIHKKNATGIWYAIELGNEKTGKTSINCWTQVGKICSKGRRKSIRRFLLSFSALRFYSGSKSAPKKKTHT